MRHLRRGASDAVRRRPDERNFSLISGYLYTIYRDMYIYLYSICKRYMYLIPLEMYMYLLDICSVCTFIYVYMYLIPLSLYPSRDVYVSIRYMVFCSYDYAIC